MFAETFDRRPRQVIEVAGESVGVLEIEERADELYLALIELTAACRGKGLGTDILRWLLRRAEEQNLPLRLHVLEVNRRAVAFYEREGLLIVDSETLKLLMSSEPLSFFRGAQCRLGRI